MAACEEPVVIPAAVFGTEGAQPALLKAFATTLPMAAPAGQTVPAPTEAKLSLYPGYHVNADVPVRGGSSGDYHPVHWDGV